MYTIENDNKLIVDNGRKMYTVKLVSRLHRPYIYEYISIITYKCTYIVINFPIHLVAEVLFK